MNVETFEELPEVARRKWKEYNEATKISNNPVYKDLKKVYNQIKGGRKIIDISKAIAKGGLNDKHQPNLAVAKASSKFVWCTFYPSGKTNFVNGSNYWSPNTARNPLKEDVSIDNCFPKWDRHQLHKEGLFPKNNDFLPYEMNLKAPVPMIPALLVPPKLTDDHYILWEVESWSIVPPRDPWLLKRITNTMFVVLAAWDLTELERAVMAGRLVD